MNTRSMSDKTLERSGINYQIVRNGETIDNTKAMQGRNSNTFQMMSDAPILIGDELISSDSGKKYEITDFILRRDVHGNVLFIEATYSTSNSNNATTQFNFGSINGSAIIGSQQNAIINIGFSIDDIAKLIEQKPAEDKQILNDLKVLLSTMKENNLPVSKGFLAKFSDVLAKHQDVLLAVGGFVATWLAG